MSKFVFFGDSITDAGRNRELDLHQSSYGYGYVRSLVSKLLKDDAKNEIYNRGYSGFRIVDIYAKIKGDVWNLSPDVLTILIGVNDVWHEIKNNGVEINRYENIYRMLINETLERLPNVKIILIEPFFLHGSATDEIYDHILKVKEYAKVVDKLAKEFGLPLVKIQDKLDSLAEVNGDQFYLYDGIHPNIAGADLIADEWFNVYLNQIKM